MGCANGKEADAHSPGRGRNNHAAVANTASEDAELGFAPVGFGDIHGAHAGGVVSKRKRPARTTTAQREKMSRDAAKLAERAQRNNASSSSDDDSDKEPASPVPPASTANRRARQAAEQSPGSESPESGLAAHHQPRRPGHTTDNALTTLPVSKEVELQHETSDAAMAMLRGPTGPAASGKKTAPKPAAGTKARVATEQPKRQFFFMDE